jgi:cell division protein FtsI (penicillin-binding protein 3)
MEEMFKDKSKTDYKNELIAERQKKTRYYLLKRNVTFNQLLEMKKWPLFREGQGKSGMMSLQNDKRLMPFGLLAQRTIGFTNTDGRKVGLEGQYDGRKNSD